MDDGRSIDLESESGGWFCSSLDLGYPEVREVVNPRPAQHGADDRTQFFGGRVVTAEISALVGAGAVIDEVAASFAPYMLPLARPTLHYVLDRVGQPERVIQLRASGYSWPIVGGSQRDIHLQWFADNPVIYDPTPRMAVAWSGSSITSGRRYDLIYDPDRTYPVGQGVAIVGRIEHAGDLNARPVLRVYGPITGPVINFASYHADGFLADQYAIGFAHAFVLGPGHFVEIDTTAYTARMDGDSQQPVEHWLIWTTLRWPVLAPLPNYTLMTLEGDSTSGVSQAQARWQDGFLA
jgi:hypothetical protein